MKLYGLIGKSLSHSFSQRYFTEKFQKENIPLCEYRNFELKDLNTGIPGLKEMADLHGLNVTIPYKTGILSFLDDLSVASKEINACNCINIKGGKWTGYNTDVVGFEKTFVTHLKPFHHKALILGTGGASNAVAFVLKKLNIEYLKVSRSAGEVGSIISYNDISDDLMDQSKIIINTTPLGTFPKVDEYPPLPYQFITNQHYCYDLVYNPPTTVFLLKSRHQGAVIENGEKMLEIQAEESWRIWNS